MKIVNPVGKEGEDIACEFLRKKGYKIIDRNYRKKYTELDIIATKNKILVFVEVKTRTTNKFGLPKEQITNAKLRSLKKSAEYYKLSHKNLPDRMRIDLISIMLDKTDDKSSIEHIEDITF